MRGSRRRALVAAVAGLLGAVLGVAGAGHAYLGEWRRAIAWFSLVLGAGLVLVSVLADPRTVTLSTLPPAVVATLVGLLVLSAADAYRVARERGTGRGTSGPPGTTGTARSCPNCGRSVDPAVGFCWYCAERVQSGDADTGPDDSTGDGPTAR